VQPASAGNIQKTVEFTAEITEIAETR